MRYTITKQNQKSTLFYIFTLFFIRAFVWFVSDHTYHFALLFFYLTNIITFFPLTTQSQHRHFTKIKTQIMSAKNPFFLHIFI